MFDELNKYKSNDHFFLVATDQLSKKCNAPIDKSGVYLVYALAKGRIELVYIGSAGKKEKAGVVSVDKKGLDGLKGEIVNGCHVDDTPNSAAWPTQMLIEDIEALDVYWYVTQDAKVNDNPLTVAKTILKIHGHIYGQLPRWNKI